MHILIGSDHIGYPLKEDLKNYLAGLGLEVVDLGCADAATPVDYPDVATELAERIAAGETDRGILICGTGIGMAITANKVPGVRAACCHDPYSAERARKSNDAQIIAMGARVIGPEAAKTVLKAWLDSEFQGGASARKVDKITALEDEELKP